MVKKNMRFGKRSLAKFMRKKKKIITIRGTKGEHLHYSVKISTPKSLKC
jgi:hypothetical protein